MKPWWEMPYPTANQNPSFLLFGCCPSPVTGEVWYPTVTENGDISWQLNDTTTPPQTENIKGPKGDVGLPGEPGPQGPMGTSPTIAVGTVTKLPCSANPTVTNVGSPSAAVFNFGIPGCKNKWGSVLQNKIATATANTPILYKASTTSPTTPEIGIDTDIPYVISGSNGEYTQYMAQAEVQIDGCASRPSFTLNVVKQDGTTVLTKVVKGITSATSGTYHLRSSVMINGELAGALNSKLSIKISVDNGGTIAYSDLFVYPIGSKSSI